jgi:hypothetical protein
MTKAMSKAERRRRKVVRYIEPKAPTEAIQIPKGADTSPTPEQMALGTYKRAKGPDRDSKPYVNIAPDMIAVLRNAGKLTEAQTEAARDFQAVYADWVAELGCQGTVSCLVERTGGFDGSDGNINAVRAYNRIRDRIGRVKTALLCYETAKGPDQRPRSLDALRNALDCMNA